MMEYRMNIGLFLLMGLLLFTPTVNAFSFDGFIQSVQVNLGLAVNTITHNVQSIFRVNSRVGNDYTVFDEAIESYAINYQEKAVEGRYQLLDVYTNQMKSDGYEQMFIVIDDYNASINLITYKLQKESSVNYNQIVIEVNYDTAVKLFNKLMDSSIKESDIINEWLRGNITVTPTNIVYNFL